MGDVVQAVPVMLRGKSGAVSELILTCRGSGTQPNARPTAVLFIDPTPRHQTIASTLAQRTRELQRIIGAFPDLFFWTDGEGRVLDYHAGSEVELRIPPEQFLGVRVSRIAGGRGREPPANGDRHLPPGAPDHRDRIHPPARPPAAATTKRGSFRSLPTVRSGWFGTLRPSAGSRRGCSG